MPATPGPPNRRSILRWRLLFALIAVLLPTGLHLLFERQARRLDALADHGATTTATATRVEQWGSGRTVFYEYAVGGETYTWSVKEQDAPYTPGAAFPVTYLPEDPSLSRPGTERARAAVEAAHNRRFAHKFEFGAFVFVLFNAALFEAKLKKLKQGQRLLISPERAGRVIALLFLAILLGTNAYADVNAVQRKVFGNTLFGLPVFAAVSFIELVLFTPYFWVFEHLTRIVFQAAEDRASLSKAGLTWYILRAHRRHPELARSRRIALAGFGYFVALVGTWLALTAWKGV